MVFAEPNPFPRSVFDNVAFGLKLRDRSADCQRPVEEALRRVGLWDEVAGNLRSPASDLTWEQQQRLCIARSIAPQPEVLLMDEPTSSLDPLGTQRVEQLIRELKDEAPIVLVAESMRQAARVSDFTGFLYRGELVEYGATDTIFTNPREDRTEAYLTGRLA
jgi:phosphate transport system ATP-binding protein